MIGGIRCRDAEGRPVWELSRSQNLQAELPQQSTQTQAVLTAVQYVFSLLNYSYTVKSEVNSLC